LKHGIGFLIRRFFNWFPLGMTYAFLYMGRYNLNVAKNALDTVISKNDFGIIFAAGTIAYALSFLINGPFVDKIGGKKGIIIAAVGSSLANITLGVLTYFYVIGYIKFNLLIVFSVVYAINMYFQSYGAVSIIKVKAYWFHVRERGIFGAIFGTLISFGVYFAFDWGTSIVEATHLHTDGDLSNFQQLIRYLIGENNSGHDATWYVFFIPALILLVWVIVDYFLIKDTPSEAGYTDFDTHDASSGEMDKQFTVKDLLVKIFTNPIILTIAIIEFSSGVIRNGIMQWYFIFTKEVNLPGSEFFHENWGLLLCIGGIIGGFSAGILSDKVFHSRRAPIGVIFNFIILIFAIILAIFLMKDGYIVGWSAVIISMTVIGVHSIMSGTAAADFGGRKATATASGITDGFVYLGTGIQSFCLGYITTWDWEFWPLFLIPFIILGIIISLTMWKKLPKATVSYLKDVEHINGKKI